MNGYLIPDDQYGSKHSGWYDDIDEAITDLGKLKGVSAYITINPVNEALFARSANRLKAKLKLTTSDKDIAHYRLLYIDFDSKRPDGVSATDEELAAAVERRDKFLTDHPELAASAIWGKSGNGAWIFVLLVGYSPDEGHDLADRCRLDR